MQKRSGSGSWLIAALLFVILWILVFEKVVHAPAGPPPTLDQFRQANASALEFMWIPMVVALAVAAAVTAWMWAAYRRLKAALV